MWRLTLRTLTRRRGAYSAVLATVFAAATIVAACGGLLAAGLRASFPPERLAGATVVVAGDPSYRLPDAAPGDDDAEWASLSETVRLKRSLVATLRAVPGVADTIGDVSFPVTLLGGDAPRGAGHEWTSAGLLPYELQAGTAPVADGDVVLDAALAARSGSRVGERVQLVVHGSVAVFRVSGVVAPAGGRTATAAALFFAPADARRLSGHPDSVDAIAVIPAPGTGEKTLADRVRAGLRGQSAVTLTGDDRGLAEFPQARAGRDNLLTVAGLIGGTTLLVGMLVLVSTMRLLVEHRAPEMTLLHAMGTPPRRIRLMMLGEVTTVSVVATAAGSVLGFHLGGWLFWHLVRDGVVPAAMRFDPGPLPAAGAAAVCLCAGLAAAFLPIWRAARPRPATVLSSPPQDHGLDRARAALALICLGVVGTTICSGMLLIRSSAVSITCLAAIVVILGVAVVASRMTKAMTGLVGRAVRARPRTIGRLALLNSCARPFGMAAAVLPIMLATGISTANIYLQMTQADQARQVRMDDLRADDVITAGPGGLAPGLLGRVRSVPGVMAASELASGSGFVETPYDGWQGEHGWPLLGLTAEGAAGVTDLALTSGTLTDLRGDSVALTQEHARHLGRGLGDAVTLRLGDGAEVELRVVALLADKPGGEVILMPATLLAAHTTAGLPTQILVRAAPGGDQRRLRSDLAEAVGRLPTVRVSDAGGLSTTPAEQQRTRAWINYLFTGVVIIFAGISVISAQAMGAASRRREFRLQRLIGFTRGQILRMVGIEAMVVAAVGVVLGTAAVAPILIPFAIAVNGSPMPYGPAWVYLAVICSTTLSALVATLSPVWAMIRPRTGEREGAPRGRAVMRA
ncbi:FtsX-like permease family protein [Nonomuraea sp. NPDC049269]|uniref:FtsX-like permease family protein n=1 Tax=Nonomuraea sp. NPDC049269 TaxID=3364349 RepID=UPI00371AE4D5